MYYSGTTLDEIINKRELFSLPPAGSDPSANDGCRKRTGREEGQNQGSDADAGLGDALPKPTHYAEPVEGNARPRKEYVRSHEEHASQEPGTRYSKRPGVWCHEFGNAGVRGECELEACMWLI